MGRRDSSWPWDLTSQPMRRYWRRSMQASPVGPIRSCGFPLVDRAPTPGNATPVGLCLPASRRATVIFPEMALPKQISASEKLGRQVTDIPSGAVGWRQMDLPPTCQLQNPFLPIFHNYTQRATTLFSRICCGQVLLGVAVCHGELSQKCAVRRTPTRPLTVRCKFCGRGA